MARFAVEVTETVVSETVIYVEADDVRSAERTARLLRETGRLVDLETKGESSATAYSTEATDRPYYTADGTFVEGDTDG